MMNSTNIQNSHENFAQLINVHYHQFKSRLELLPPEIIYQNCISKVTFRGKHGIVNVFYGAPEWHLEMYFESHGVKWTLGDVVGVFSSVRDWIANNNPNNNSNRIRQNLTLEREIILFYLLLSDVMSYIQEFAWIGNHMGGGTGQNTSIEKTHDEAIKKLVEYKEKTHETLEKEYFRNHIVLQANTAWENKHYSKFVELLFPYANKLTKLETAKLHYAINHSDKKT